jgi:hypothetical protein
MEISKVIDQIELFTILKEKGFHKGILIEDLKVFDSSKTLHLQSNYLSHKNIYVKIEEFEKLYRTMDKMMQWNILFVRD